MVLYRYNFCDEAGDTPARLTPYGKTRLMRMARMLHHGYPIVVEPTPGRPRLDAARRQTVLSALDALGLDRDSQMVVIRQPEAPGLAGEEAIAIHGNMLRHTESGGSIAGAGGGAMPAGTFGLSIGP